MLVGEDPASQVYVRNKGGGLRQRWACSVMHKLPAATTEAELLALIGVAQSRCRDPRHPGAIAATPTSPKEGARSGRCAKDVDGFHAENVGALMIGEPRFVSCTPAGCMEMLRDIGMTDLRGKHAVVVGRSNIVGKPMAMLLLHANATVTICHSGTRDLDAQCRQADILVAAVGRPFHQRPTR